MRRAIVRELRSLAVESLSTGTKAGAVAALAMVAAATVTRLVLHVEPMGGTYADAR